MKHDVFISYSSADNKIAFELCKMLESSNIICWISPRNVLGGKSYAREIVEAINESRVVLFIFSSSSNRSPHVESEIDAAFNAGKIIIPFRIEDIPMSPELSYYLNKKHHIDGIPSPSSKYSELRKSILNNLPRLQNKKADSSYLTNLRDEVVKRKINKFYIMETVKINPDYSSFILAESKGQKPEVNIYRRVEDGTIEGFTFILSPLEKEPQNPLLVLEDEGNRAVYFRSTESYVTFFEVGDARSGLRGVDEVHVSEVVITEENPDDNLVTIIGMIPIEHVKNLDEICRYISVKGNLNK